MALIPIVKHSFEGFYIYKKRKIKWLWTTGRVKARPGWPLPIPTPYASLRHHESSGGAPVLQNASTTRSTRSHDGWPRGAAAGYGAAAAGWFLSTGCVLVPRAVSTSSMDTSRFLWNLLSFYLWNINWSIVLVSLKLSPNSLEGFEIALWNCWHLPEAPETLKTFSDVWKIAEARLKFISSLQTFD